MHQTKDELSLPIEIGNAISHGIATGLAIAGLVILIVHAAQLGGAMRIVTTSIYGSILVLFFLSSTLFHALIYTRAQHVFRVFDHAMIFLLIAASYTPISLVTIGGWQGWTLLGNCRGSLQKSLAEKEERLVHLNLYFNGLAMLDLLSDSLACPPPTGLLVIASRRDYLYLRRRRLPFQTAECPFYLAFLCHCRVSLHLLYDLIVRLIGVAKVQTNTQRPLLWRALFLRLG